MPQIRPYCPPLPQTHLTLASLSSLWASVLSTLLPGKPFVAERGPVPVLSLSLAGPDLSASKALDTSMSTVTLHRSLLFPPLPIS